MSTNKTDDIRHDVLVAVQDKLNEELVPTNLSEKDEYGVETLAVVLEDSTVEGYDATAEFFFYPYEDGDELQHFTSLITISDELYENTIQELCACVSGINSYMPAEGFAIDFVSRSLIFKHTYVMPVDLDASAMQENVELAISMSLQTVGEYGYLLAEVNDGMRTAESVLKLFVP